MVSQINPEISWVLPQLFSCWDFFALRKVLKALCECKKKVFHRCTKNGRIVKVGKDLQGHPVQPSPGYIHKPLPHLLRGSPFHKWRLCWSHRTLLFFINPCLLDLLVVLHVPCNGAWEDFFHILAWNRGLKPWSQCKALVPLNLFKRSLRYHISLRWHKGELKRSPQEVKTQNLLANFRRSGIWQNLKQEFNQN